jgi:hypothetical protein
MREKVSAWIGEQRRRARAMRDAGQFDLSGIFKVVGVVLVAVVTVQVLGDLAGTFFDSLNDFVTVYTGNNTTTGHQTADELMPTLGLIAAIVGPLALLGLALVSMRFRRP